MKANVSYLLSLTFLAVGNTLFAQGTAFTYQGNLNGAAGPATGSYDLTFTLFKTNATGVASAGPVTNSATVVSNGLFTTTIDFGAGAFAAGANWLEIGVRTNGGGAFATLAPRQQITPAPYAITAGTAASSAAPAGMALIPAGSFTMGDNLDGETDATPTNVTVSAFYMDVNLVSYSQWQSVYYWATNHGYFFVNAGAGRAANHPVQTVDWFDMVKWCNARSQQAGLTPVYYTDTGLTQVYTNGEVAPYPNWSASGYRLPTEAEWEKAARGGLIGQRFPWGNDITENLANYVGSPATYAFDLGPSGYNATFTASVPPYTNPGGYFAPNGYGLYDMAGNVFAWCWDWYGSTYAGGINPQGAASGTARVLRGGAWISDASYARVANRVSFSPSAPYYDFGFRCVRGL